MKATRIRPGRNGKPRGDFIDGVPPHDLEAERATLGSILHDPSRLGDVSAIVQPSDFHDDRHSRLFEHLQNAPAEVLGDDVSLLVRWLKAAGDLEACGGRAHLAQLLGSVGAPSHAAYYAKIVRDTAQRRRLIARAVALGQAAYLGGDDLATLAAELREAVESHAGPDRFPMRSASDIFYGDFSLRFLVDDIVAEGQATVVGGPSKSLKTSLLVDLAASLAAGAPFLGRFRVPEPLPVIVMTGESGAVALKNMLWRIAYARGIAPDDPDFGKRFHISEKLPQFDDPTHLAEVGRLVRRCGAKLLIIDPLYLSLGDAAESSQLQKMGPMFRRANEAVLSAGCTLIVAHHTVKRPGNGARDPHAPLQREDLHGAGVAEWARAWILVNRSGPFEEGSGLHELNMVVGGSGGFSSRWQVTVDEGRFDKTRTEPPGPGLEKWDVTVQRAAEAAEEARRERERQQRDEARERLRADTGEVFDAMKRAGECLTKREIREATFGGKRFESAFADLLDTGNVRFVPDGVVRANGQRYGGYEVVSNG